MYETFDPSTSRSTQVACAADLKKKMIEKNAREVMRANQKGPIRVKNTKNKRKYSKQPLTS